MKTSGSQPARVPMSELDKVSFSFLCSRFNLENVSMGLNIYDR